jgi:hypothetical protein
MWPDRRLLELRKAANRGAWPKHPATTVLRLGAGLRATEAHRITRYKSGAGNSRTRGIGVDDTFLVAVHGSDLAQLGNVGMSGFPLLLGE